MLLLWPRWTLGARISGESPVALWAARWPVQPYTPGARDLSYLVTEDVHPQLCICAWERGLHLVGLCLLTS